MQKQHNETVKVNGHTYTLKDMRNWFIQIRSFHSILFFGHGAGEVNGEGQYGGRLVSELAHKVEDAFVDKLGVDAYRRKLDELMKGHEHENGGGYT